MMGWDGMRGADSLEAKRKCKGRRPIGAGCWLLELV